MTGRTAASGAFRLLITLLLAGAVQHPWAVAAPAPRVPSLPPAAVQLVALSTRTTTSPTVHWHGTTVWKSPREAHVHPPPPSPTPSTPPGHPYPYLSPDDFVALWYAAQPQPGTAYGPTPAIYGYAAGDQRIRGIAESRGYRRQPVSTTGALNPEAVKAFDEMAGAARRESGISLIIVSGFRSTSRQSELFRQGVAALYGRTPREADIVSGSADSAINRTLDLRSIPGYSRHHTGYTVDINRTDDSFARTAAYAWLSAKNFTNARRFGFVPSYPVGTTTPAGPQPESWEFSYLADRTRVQ